jgi:hypothetical protein
MFAIFLTNSRLELTDKLTNFHASLNFQHQETQYTQQVLWKAVREGMSWGAGRCRRVQISELFSLLGFLATPKING